MNGGLFQADAEDRGLVLDPRTKLLIMMAWFVLGGAAHHIHPLAIHLFCALPAVLLLSAKRWRQALAYVGLYALTYSAFALVCSFSRLSLWSNSRKLLVGEISPNPH